MRRLLVLSIGVCLASCSLKYPQSASDVLPTAAEWSGDAVTQHLTCAPLNLATSLYVANGSNDLLTLASPYTHPPKTAAAVSLASDVAFDSKKNMFVSQDGAKNVAEFQPPYTGAPIVQTKLALSQPYGVAVDGQDDLFIADSGKNRVFELAPPYTKTPKAVVSQEISAPDGLAFDKHCNLFVSNQGTRTVTEYAPPYSKGPIAKIGSGDLSTPTGLAVWGTRLYVDDNAKNDVLVFEAPYRGAPVQTIHLPGKFPEPYGAAFDSKGQLFVGLYGEGAVVEYAPPYTKVMRKTHGNLSTVEGIAIGP